MNDERQAAVDTDEYFGGCPQCGKNDGYLNVGANHWFFCNEHKTRWCIGWNVFSSWQDEDNACWEKNAQQLSEYAEVEPLHPKREDDRMNMEKPLFDAIERICKETNPLVTEGEIVANVVAKHGDLVRELGERVARQQIEHAVAVLRCEEEDKRLDAFARRRKQDIPVYGQ